MTKRRTRVAQRELTRAELIAIERRSSTQAPTATEMPVPEAYPDEPMATASVKRGVLPTRVAAAGGTLSRVQEMAYIRADLRRLAILSGLMLAILAILAIVLR